MLAPLRRTLRIAVHAWLFFERLAQHGVQAANFFVVARFGSVDGFLCQVVAQHVQRVDSVHAGAALVLVDGAFAVDAGDVEFAPGVEALEVDEVIAKGGDGLLGRLVAQSAEEQAVVDAAVLHQLQQTLQ
ncbi:hypothetical protein D9M69_658910 [compost metagenome]